MLEIPHLVWYQPGNADIVLYLSDMDAPTRIEYHLTYTRRMCYHRPSVRMEDRCLQALSIHLAWSFTARTVDDWFANDALTILWVYLVGLREENILSTLLNFSSMDRTSCPRWLWRCHSCLHCNTNGRNKQTTLETGWTSGTLQQLVCGLTRKIICWPMAWGISRLEQWNRLLRKPPLVTL